MPSLFGQKSWFKLGFRRYLVGGFNLPLWKNMSSSDWIIIPTIGENIHVPNHQPVIIIVNRL
jgi:hypothetical protein